MRISVHFFQKNNKSSTKGIKDTQQICLFVNLQREKSSFHSFRNNNVDNSGATNSTSLSLVVLESRKAKKIPPNAVDEPWEAWRSPTIGSDDEWPDVPIVHSDSCFSFNNRKANFSWRKSSSNVCSLPVRFRCRTLRIFRRCRTFLFRFGEIHHQASSINDLSIHSSFRFQRVLLRQKCDKTETLSDNRIRCLRSFSRSSLLWNLVRCKPLPHRRSCRISIRWKMKDDWERREDEPRRLRLIFPLTRWRECSRRVNVEFRRHRRPRCSSRRNHRSDWSDANETRFSSPRLRHRKCLTNSKESSKQTRRNSRSCTEANELFDVMPVMDVEWALESKMMISPPFSSVDEVDDDSTGTFPSDLHIGNNSANRTNERGHSSDHKQTFLLLTQWWCSCWCSDGDDEGHGADNEGGSICIWANDDANDQFAGGNGNGSEGRMGESESDDRVVVVGENIRWLAGERDRVDWDDDQKSPS